MADSKRHGTFARGERIGTSVLLELEVEAVRALTVAGWPNLKIARLLGVSSDTTRNIRTGATWKYAKQ